MHVARLECAAKGQSLGLLLGIGHADPGVARIAVRAQVALHLKFEERAGAQQAGDSARPGPVTKPADQTGGRAVQLAADQAGGAGQPASGR